MTFNLPITAFVIAFEVRSSRCVVCLRVYAALHFQISTTININNCSVSLDLYKVYFYATPLNAFIFAVISSRITLTLTLLLPLKFDVVDFIMPKNAYAKD